jgi:ATP-binding cassette subfamily C protein CydC
MRELIRLLRLHAPYWRWMAAGSAFGLITVLANFGLLALSGWFLASAAAAGLAGYAAQNAFNLFTPAAGVRFFATVRVLGRYAARILDHEATFRLIAAIRVHLFARLVPLAPLGLADRGGDLLARLVADVERLSDFYPRVLAPLLIAAAASAVMVLVVGLIAPPAALALFLLLLAAGVAVPLIGLRRGAAPGREIVALEAGLRADMVDAMQGMADLLTCGAAGAMAARIAAADAALIARQRRMRGIEGMAAAATTLLASAAMLAMLLIGIPLVRAGTVSGPVLALLVLGALAAFEAVAPLGQALPLLGQIRASARRVFEIIDRPAPVDDPAASPPRPTGLDLELRGVRLRYGAAGPEGRAFALDGLDLRIPQGSRMILVGRSGAGKTSVASLLLRFAPYQDGSARLGGVELRDIRGDDVRSLFTMVSQRSFLFHGTIRDNLLLARPGADEAQLWHALETAQLAAFVRAQPEGLDTLVGEGGARISGGEARRVALARAVLRDTPWLILDEPMEGLDAVTATALRGALDAVMAGRTVLWMTHRLDMIADTDQVAVLDAGRVIEAGPVAVLRRDGRHLPRLLRLQRDLGALGSGAAAAPQPGAG